MRIIGAWRHPGFRPWSSRRSVGNAWRKWGRGSKEVLHFAFGHWPRVCPGKHLGQLETALVVGAFVKLFRFRAVQAASGVKAGVSTKPSDGTLAELELRWA